MARPRTTSCGLEHYGGSCRACATERKRRSRARGTPESVTLDERQRADSRARGYVNAYVRRYAIVPDDACARCYEHDGVVSGSVALVPFHPNPLLRREVVWLCEGCRRLVRESRCPVYSSWVWPGGYGVQTRAISNLLLLLGGVRENLAPRLASLPVSSRATVEVGTLVAGLDRRRAQGLLARAVLLGDAFRPTGDFALDDAFRRWARTEHAYLCERARDAGCETRAPIDRSRPARVHAPVMENPRIAPPMEYDADADARMDEALTMLDRANDVADDINARVEAALRSRRLTGSRLT